ncbi:MAG: hypothetical protein BWY64_03437 [bacterium ADurb.Bin363]|nr:MAG: hypothetical protein BWY64_03437 [bacterium ADurb.Bin363]
MFDEAIIRNIFNTGITQKNDPSRFFYDLGNVILEEFLSVKLIGEFIYTLNRNIYNVLKENLSSLFTLHSPSTLRHLNTRQTRATLSLYMVWAGIYFHKDKENRKLWQYIFEELNIPQEQKLSSQFGHMFMECLGENNLETFDNAGERQGYITRILLHGLIPEVYIDTFIKEIIFPVFNNPEWIYETGSSLISKVLLDGKKMQTLPRAIQTFLQYGKPVNEILLDRILEMAGDWEEEISELSWQWVLPDYIVNTFRNNLQDIKISKKSIENKSLVITLPTLSFNLTKGDSPVITFPRLKETLVNYKDLLEKKEESASSSSGELPVGPSREWHINISGKDYYIRYNFPLSDEREELPLFIFNNRDYKAINLKNNRYPDEIIIIYPKKAVMKFSEVFRITPSIELSRRWQGWNFIFCSIKSDGLISYKGPDINFEKTVETRITFYVDSNPDKPFLLCNETLPPWIICNEEIPIIVSPEKLNLCFTRESLSRWRRGRCKITDIQGRQYDLFPLNYEDEDKNIPIPLGHITPGIYEIQLRGATGIDDLIMPFVYLPLETYKRNFSGEKSLYAKSFSLVFSKFLEFIPCDNTSVSFYRNKLTIFAKENLDDTFCGIKLFSNTERPLILLFARSDIRWTKGNSLSIDWKDWKIHAEYLPLQKLDDYSDLRILLDINENTLELQDIKENRRLRFSMEAYLEGSSEKTPLMSYETFVVKTGMHYICIIEIKKFIDQVRFLNIELASIILRKSNISILNLIKYPEYRGFKIETIKEKPEEIRINWIHNPRDPLNDRIVKFHPLEFPDEITVRNIKDGQFPPITMGLEGSKKGGIWIAYIDTQGDRKFIPGLFKKETRWMRLPEGWSDWMEWGNINKDKLLELYDTWKDLPSEKKLESIPWSYFLYLFYYGKDALQFKTLIGDFLLTLPFSCGSIWKFKNDSSTIRLEVVSLNSDKNRNFSPSEWYKISGDFIIELKEKKKKSSKKSKKTSGLWKFSRKDKLLILLSDKKESFFLNDMPGAIEIEMPLEKLWDSPSFLPILKWISPGDENFVTGSKLEGILSDSIDPDINKKAIKLIDRWKEFAKDSLLVNIIGGRLNRNPSEILTGTIAFIYRLKAHDYEYFKSLQNSLKDLEKLLYDTLDFVKLYLPRAFLRDLILAEILISWYWKKVPWDV